MFCQTDVFTSNYVNVRDFSKITFCVKIPGETQLNDRSSYTLRLNILKHFT